MSEPVEIDPSFGDRWQSAKDKGWQSRLDAERALADAAADIFATAPPDPRNQHKVDEWLARYREARQP